MNRARVGRAALGWTAGVALVVGCGVGLSGCGDSGQGLARQACNDVDKSLALYAQSKREPDPAKAALLAERAYIQLRDALPLSADAASESANWQPLMTDLSEINRVTEGYLVTSLQQQCAAVGNPNPPPPAAPSTSTPTPTRPTPGG